MPLMIDAFEGNRAETKTMIPLVQRFVAAHGIAGVTVIADAGMMSEVNLAEIEDAGWSFVIGGKLPEVPYAIKQWRQANPDLEPADGMVLTQPVIMGPKADQRRRTTLYQYKSDRARRSVHGIEQQVAKAEKAVAGQAAIKRNRFVTLSGGARTVNRELETKARTLAGWKPYVTNIVDADPVWVIGAYHQLWRIEHAFRMSKHDLRARPVYHHKRESIDAHLAVVFAALAISHRIEARTGWTIKKFVRALRRYRTVKINTGSHTLAAEDPPPDDVRQALAAIHHALIWPNSGSTIAVRVGRPYCSSSAVAAASGSAFRSHRHRSASWCEMIMDSRPLRRQPDYEGLRFRKQAYCARKPPSTGSIAPVMKDASSEARNKIAFATSLGSPSLPIGCAAFTASRYSIPPGSSGSRCTRSVLIVPGATALTRMPLAAHSTARCFVRPEATNFAGP
jgi:hypothetical protein